jgi:thiol-disulfide isomerase/thioredoxin
MKKWLAILAAITALTFGISALAGENLRLNSHLDYSSDHEDGPLITGDHMDEGAVPGKPNYVMMYAEGCYNSKRQARRTVSLYEKYKDRVNFVVVDLDQRRSPAQLQLVKDYYKGNIPHVVVLDKSGTAVYNSSGEVEEDTISAILDKSLR